MLIVHNGAMPIETYHSLGALPGYIPGISCFLQKLSRGGRTSIDPHGALPFLLGHGLGGKERYTHL